MTLRQQLLKMVYPVYLAFTRLLGRRSRIVLNKFKVRPRHSLYELSIRLNNGKEISLENFRGRKVLLVNTASDCIYTAQYDALQKLQDRYGDKLTVIGFPSNDFQEQEQAADADIARFCTVNYGVQFPLALKSTVVNASGQHPVFHWLTHEESNGWNAQTPSWNFSKYLVDEEGTLTHYFDPSIEPLGKEITEAIET